jgi:hypothetical protein
MADASPLMRLLMERRAMSHKLEIDDQGVVHAFDTDGEPVIYDAAFNQLFQMEALILVSATQYIAIAERESVPDKSKGANPQMFWLHEL